MFQILNPFSSVLHFGIMNTYSLMAPSDGIYAQFMFSLYYVGGSKVDLLVVSHPQQRVEPVVAALACPPPAAERVAHPMRCRKGLVLTGGLLHERIAGFRRRRLPLQPLRTPGPPLGLPLGSPWAPRPNRPESTGSLAALFGQSPIITDNFWRSQSCAR